MSHLTTHELAGLRAELEAALSRLEGCGGAIPFGRLLIFPETSTCQDCGT